MQIKGKKWIKKLQKKLINLIKKYRKKVLQILMNLFKNFNGRIKVPNELLDELFIKKEPKTINFRRNTYFKI